MTGECVYSATTEAMITNSPNILAFDGLTMIICFQLNGTSMHLELSNHEVWMFINCEVESFHFMHAASNPYLHIDQPQTPTNHCQFLVERTPPQPQHHRSQGITFRLRHFHPTACVQASLHMQIFTLHALVYSTEMGPRLSTSSPSI